MLSKTQKLATLAILKEVDHLDSMQLRNKFNKATDEHVDHHEMALFLDELHRIGIVEFDPTKVRIDRFTVYKVASFASSNPVKLWLRRRK